MNLIKKIIIAGNYRASLFALSITFFGIMISKNYLHFELLLSGIFTMAFVYLFNSFCDVEEDKINKPAYVLSSPFERFVSKIVLALYLFLSLFFSLIFSILSFVMVLIIIALGFFYSFKIKNFRFKNIPVVKNLVMAFGWSLLIFVGSMQVNILSSFSALLIFLILFTAGSLSDVEDIEGDLKAGIITIPSLLGVHRFCYLVLLIQCVGIFLVLVSILYGFPFYFLLMILIYFIYIIGISYAFGYCTKNKKTNAACWHKITATLSITAALIILFIAFSVFLFNI
jgi:4-hydroxybenzoate polyprenyltransferase